MSEVARAPRLSLDGLAPPTLTLPLKGGGDTGGEPNKYPLPLEGGGRGGGDLLLRNAES
jgi:hypothetical protein